MSDDLCGCAHGYSALYVQIAHTQREREQVAIYDDGA